MFSKSVTKAVSTNNVCFSFDQTMKILFEPMNGVVDAILSFYVRKTPAIPSKNFKIYEKQRRDGR